MELTLKQPTAAAPAPLAVVVREARTGREVGASDIPTLQLLPLMAEVWRDGFLRRGRTTVDLADLKFTAQVASDSQRPGTTLVLGARLQGAPEVYKRFQKDVFTPLAAACCAKLVETGRLAADTEIRFELIAPAGAPAELNAGSAADANSRGYPEFPLARLLPAGGYSEDQRFRSSLRSQRLCYGGVGRNRTTPIPDNPVLNQADFPVLYTRHAYENADRFSRAGAMAVPPAESGCMLLGYVCVSSEPSDCFVVVTEALRIQAAETKTFSLSLTSESWTRIERYLAAHAGAGLKPVGTGHGHNFDPSANGSSCRFCSKQASCELHTAFLSRDDENFMNAVFPSHRHPFQLAQVFGVGVAGVGRDALFSLRDGRLQPRPYHVIETLPDDFLNAEQHTGAAHEKIRTA
ncbi:MAG: hypothetical protein HY343_04155 [Lentisphaerae bacterium]|nr:hypothetical protein [Lentisphaerota bacterium]